MGSKHTVVVDYSSCCIFERKLKSLASIDIISALKDIFCDVGSPDRFITDKACYFVSEEFTKFKMDWSIQHLMSSPGYPQGNGMAEKAVGIVKRTLCKM